MIWESATLSSSYSVAAPTGGLGLASWTQALSRAGHENCNRRGTVVDALHQSKNTDPQQSREWREIGKLTGTPGFEQLYWTVCFHVPFPFRIGKTFRADHGVSNSGPSFFPAS